MSDELQFAQKSLRNQDQIIETLRKKNSSLTRDRDYLKKTITELEAKLDSSEAEVDRQRITWQKFAEAIGMDMSKQIGSDVVIKRAKLLLTIVNKLHLTADGVPIVLGMKLFGTVNGNPHEFTVYWIDDSGRVGDSDRLIFRNYCCYSTKEAAQLLEGKT